MSDFTNINVSVSPEPANNPPRVKVSLVDQSSPAGFVATVTRLDPDGRTRIVRTADGGPLTLTDQGVNRQGILYDYEMPYGVEVTYSTLEAPNQSDFTSVESDAVWLVHPGVPALSMPIELAASSFGGEDWDIAQGVHWPLGSQFPVVQTDGQRKAPSGAFTVTVKTADELVKLRALLGDASTLMLNVSPSLGLGIDPCYIAVGKVQKVRPPNVGTDPLRSLVLPYQVVDQPAGGSQSERTYVDVLADNSSYADLMANYSSYGYVLTGP